MSQLYPAAIREHPPLVVVNPFDHLELPRIEPRPVEFLGMMKLRRCKRQRRRSARSGGR